MAILAFRCQSWSGEAPFRVSGANMPRMSKLVFPAVAAVALGIGVTATAMFWRPAWLAPQATPPAPLSQPEIDKVLLYAALKDGELSGKFFNQNNNITVTEITVAAVPKEEINPLNKFPPHLFSVTSTARPQSMSGEFRVATGALHPDFYILGIAAAQGVALRQ